MPIIKSSQTAGYRPPYEQPVTVVSIGGKPVQQEKDKKTGVTLYTASQEPTSSTTTQPAQTLPTQTQQSNVFQTEKETQTLQKLGVQDQRQSKALPDFTTQKEKEQFILQKVGVQQESKIDPIDRIREGQPLTTRTSPLGETAGTFQARRTEVEARKAFSQDVQQVQKEFKSDPKSFVGKPGVESMSVMGEERITLTPAYFETRFGDKDYYKIGKTKAKEQFKALPATEQFKLSAKEDIIVAGKTGIGIGEFVGTLPLKLGTQQIREGQQFGLTGFKGAELDFGRYSKTARGIKETPLSFEGELKQATVFLLAKPKVGAGKTAFSLGKTAEALAPIKAAPMRYLQPPKGMAEINIVQKGEGFVGAGKFIKSPEVEIVAFGKTKGARQLQGTLIKQPFIEVAPGAKLKTGNQYTFSTGFGRTRVSQKEGIIQPFLTETKVQPLKFSYARGESPEFYLYRTRPETIKQAGFIKQEDSLGRFTAGKRGRFTSEQPFALEKSTGRLTSFTPEVRGRIIQPRARDEGDFGVTIFKGDKALKTASKPFIPTITKQSFAPPKIVTKPSTPVRPIAGFDMRSQPKQSMFQGLGTYERTDEVLGFRPPTRTQQTFTPISGERFKPSFTFQGLSLEGIRPETRTRISPSFVQPTAIRPSEALRESPAIRQQFRQRQDFTFKQPTITEQRTTTIAPPSFTGFGFGETPRLPSFNFGLPIFAPLRKAGKAKKGKRKYQRLPSLAAAGLNIKSRTRARGEETGLVIRPILT